MHLWWLRPLRSRPCRPPPTSRPRRGQGSDRFRHAHHNSGLSIALDGRHEPIAPLRNGLPNRGVSAESPACRAGAHSRVQAVLEIDERVARPQLAQLIAGDQLAVVRAAPSVAQVVQKVRRRPLFVARQNAGPAQRVQTERVAAPPARALSCLSETGPNSSIARIARRSPLQSHCSGLSTACPETSPRRRCGTAAARRRLTAPPKPL
jgi:hypothetical protein